MLCLSWEQEMLISGSYDKSIVLWDLRGEADHWGHCGSIYFSTTTDYSCKSITSFNPVAFMEIECSMTI